MGVPKLWTHFSLSYLGTPRILVLLGQPMPAKIFDFTTIFSWKCRILKQGHLLLLWVWLWFLTLFGRPSSGHFCPTLSWGQGSSHVTRDPSPRGMVHKSLGRKFKIMGGNELKNFAITNPLLPKILYPVSSSLSSTPPNNAPCTRTLKLRLPIWKVLNPI